MPQIWQTAINYLMTDLYAMYTTNTCIRIQSFLHNQKVFFLTFLHIYEYYLFMHIIILCSQPIS